LKVYQIISNHKELKETIAAEIKEGFFIIVSKKRYRKYEKVKKRKKKTSSTIYR